ncbi:hypothetical protein F2Q70_00011356 [Brassica cretica]|uniref:Uncharacterized protein n=1 Tax=Brassica cretica TaxID=69181 RepID=A0A8S9LXH2_BRACR|nr:hypothetical protein F2Q70_00011356 [Brassica cretica]
MPNSTRSNKETQLLFSPDPASLERSICKEACSSFIDNNACSSLDSRQPQSTQELVTSTDTRSPPSTDTHSPPSTEDTHLPSTDTFRPTSINNSVRTSIATEPRDMVATLILVRDERGDLYDQEGHLRNATDEAARPRTLADYNRPDQFYTNRSAIRPPTIQRDFELKPQYYTLVGQTPYYGYMLSSTRSNKETQLIFSPDPASLERSIRKEARSSSIDNNACSLLDSRQPLSTQALVPSTGTRSPSSTEDTNLPSTYFFHPTSIDTSVRTSIDTEPRAMVATLILVRDERGDLYDKEGHLRNATVELDSKVLETKVETETPMEIWAISTRVRSTRNPTATTTEEADVNFISGIGFQASGERREAPRRRFRSRESDEFRRIALVSIDAKPRKLVDRSHPKPIDILSWTSIDNTYGVNRILQCREDHDSRGVRSKTPTSAQPCLQNPPEAVRTPSEDETYSMEVDRVPTGRTLRRRKEKMAKHLKRRANEKENESFQKRVFRIPLDKPFDEAYFTHRLWMFFIETRETEEDIRRMFCEPREHMRKRVTLKKKSDHGQFAIPCTVKGTCLVVPEATRKLNCYSHQILQVWSVQSAKRHAPHRSTTMLVRRSILVDPGTSPVDRYSLTTVDRIHSSPVDRHLSSNIDRYFSTNIDRY